MIDRIGQQLGNYRLTQVIGEGGFATVYLGEHLYLKNQAAIKMLHTDLSYKERIDFLREAQCLIGLKHPHIVRCLDFAMEDDAPFLVMEYAPHGSLRTQHPRGSRLPLDTIITYVKQVGDALQYLHEHKLVHRDVKPENLLLDTNKDLLLSDFGIVAIAHRTTSLTGQGLVGTPGYMAPEQLEGMPRPASDQYGLGILVYEWLCGRRPFVGPDWSVVEQHFNSTPPPLHEHLSTISSSLENVVLKALAKDPKQRFASVQDFVGTLEQAHQEEQAYAATQKFSVNTPVGAAYLSAQPALVGVVPLAEISLLATGTPASRQTTVADPPRVASPPPPTRADSPAASGRVARRTAVLGLGLTGLALAAGGTTWLMNSQPASLSQISTKLASAPTTTTTTPASIASSSSPGTVLSSYTGHGDTIEAIAWSPDCQYLASCSKDGTVHVSDAATAKHIRTYDGHAGTLYKIAWSPNGKWIASGGSDTNIRVWDVQSGQLVSTYRGHASYVTTLAWSSDSKHIVSGAAQDTVQVWDALTGKTLLIYSGHANGANIVAYSPDGLSIASGGNDKTVQIWNVSDGSPVYTYRKHADAVNALAWSPDSQRIVSGDKTTVQAWVATDSGNLLYSKNFKTTNGLAWSLDGQRIAVSNMFGRTVQLWNATDGTLLLAHEWNSGMVCSVAWAPQLNDLRIAQGGVSDPPGGPSPVQVWIGRQLT